MTTKRKAPIKTHPNGSAQRQAAYRVRHLKSEDGKLQRLSLLVDLHVKCALERLATCYCVTQKSMLESLILQAQQAAITAAIVDSPNAQQDYYEGRLRLQGVIVTQ
jgi:hypothetical protein